MPKKMVDKVSVCRAKNTESQVDVVATHTAYSACRSGVQNRGSNTKLNAASVMFHCHC